jgi:hypothetical protein
MFKVDYTPFGESEKDIDNSDEVWRLIGAGMSLNQLQLPKPPKTLVELSKFLPELKDLGSKIQNREVGIKSIPMYLSSNGDMKGLRDKNITLYTSPMAISFKEYQAVSDVCGIICGSSTSHYSEPNCCAYFSVRSWKHALRVEIKCGGLIKLLY